MRVCISGGDVTGLIAAYMCRKRGHSVVLVERSQLGASAFSPALKFLERTDEVLALLDELGVVYGEYKLVPGLLEKGRVEACPRKVSDAVHYAYWRKTRLTAMPPGAIGLDDVEVTRKRQAVSFDWHTFVKRLATGLTVVRELGTLPHSADLIFETLPLWESTLVREGAREAMAVALNLLPVRASKDRYLRWDVIYTPHTPGGAIHRLYHGEESGYVCEFSGVAAEDSVISDLNYLFPDGWHIGGPMATTHGKLVALSERPIWMPRVRPLGRVAQWDDASTATRVIRDVAEGLLRADA